MLISGVQKMLQKKQKIMPGGQGLQESVRKTT